MTRFLFGYWPAGEPDPWRETADFLPALFGYTELYEVSTGRMSDPPRRATGTLSAMRTLSKSTTSAVMTVSAGCVPKIVFFADLESGGYSWLRDENGQCARQRDVVVITGELLDFFEDFWPYLLIAANAFPRVDRGAVIRAIRKADDVITYVINDTEE
jgi:hypothetical protein